MTFRNRISTVLFMILFLLAGLGAFGEKNDRNGPRLMADDGDGDGVPDSVDVCPAENASFFDRDGDGCIDEITGARHIEYWGKEDTIKYFLQTDGAPGISDGSDFTALQNAMNSWPAIAGTDLNVVYGGTTSQQDADGLDRVNLITFKDAVYPFSSAILAVCITTSFTVDSLYNGKHYRPGQIVDADMIFNGAKTFRTTTSGGSGTYIQSTAAHEAGHFYGLSHSAVLTSTMFYVLAPGTNASTLESDDVNMFLKAYPDSQSLAQGNRLGGVVTDGTALPAVEPVPGAAVFVINAASGDTTGCEFTLPDGSYEFVGIPDGSYYVSIYPVDRTSPIGYLRTDLVNSLVDSTANTLFKPEYYDLSESHSDDPASKDAVAVSGGSYALNIDIITNVDITPPNVLRVSPAANQSNVRIDAAVVISFSEPIASSTFQGNFSLTDTATSTFVSGHATFLKDDSVMAFTPMSPLDYSMAYELNLGTGIKDKFNNGLASPYIMKFRTEAEPPLAVSSIVPNKGIPGAVVVLNGAGFDTTRTNNIVTFTSASGTDTALVSSAAPMRLVVKVPSQVVTGAVNVYVGANAAVGPTFTKLSPVQIAKGTVVSSAALGSVPKSIDILSDESYAYVATQDGASAVSIDQGSMNYMTSTAITITGGLDELDSNPAGKRVYGVSRNDSSISVISSDPSEGPGIFNHVISTLRVGDEPMGIIIEPTGRKAYVPTSSGVIQIWDVLKSSATYWQQIGEIQTNDTGLLGKAAISPTGEQLLVLSGNGRLLAFALGPDTLQAEIQTGFNPVDVIVDPTGEEAYISDSGGSVAVVSLSSLFKVQDISTGGSLRGLSIAPGGSYLYAANRELNNLDIVDLIYGSGSFRSVAGNVSQGTNPVDVEVAPSGVYAYTLTERDKSLIVNNIKWGPTLKSLSKRYGPVGTQLVISGEGFELFLENNKVYFQSSSGPIFAYPSQSYGSALIVDVPSGAVSGPVWVEVTLSDEIAPPINSNALFFEVLETSPPPGGLRLAVKAGHPDPSFHFSSAIAFTPLGDIAVVGGSGRVTLMDADPASLTFNKFLKTTNIDTSWVRDIAVAPDGKKAYLAAESGIVPIIDIDRYSAGFGNILGAVDLDTFNVGALSSVAVSPDGETCLIGTKTSPRILIADIIEGSPTENTVTSAVPIILPVGDIAFHPSGYHAYITSYDALRILDLDPYSITKGNIIATLPLGNAAVSSRMLSFTPDGSSCRALSQYSPELVTWYRHISVEFDTADPANPVWNSGMIYRVSAAPAPAGIDVSPRGGRVLAAVPTSGLINMDLNAAPDSVLSYYSLSAPGIDIEYAPDANRAYAVAMVEDSILIFDFSQSYTLNLVSGSGQTGIINQALPAPLRVSVTDSLGSPARGIPVGFLVLSGGGIFAGTDSSMQITVTNSSGIAEAAWHLGPVLGTGAQEVIVGGPDLIGSPVHFTADAIEEPAALPLTLTGFVPADGYLNTSVTTSVLTSFSRSINPASVTASTISIHKKGEAAAVPAVIGFADANKRVSLTPSAALEYDTTYVIEVASGVLDDASGALQNPDSSEFSTQSPPPLVLSSINPPSAALSVSLVLKGSGFDPNPVNNTVFFGSVSTTPYEAGVDYLKVKVPPGAATGMVQVHVGASVSNSKVFVLLVPNKSPVDEVIASVGTGSATKSVTLSPDGSMAYTLSPEGDMVIPIEVAAQKSMPGISVGDHPIAIDIHPGGKYAYVANFNSGTVSVLDIDTNSPTKNTVDTTLTVGANPIDLAVSSDGDRVIIANAGSNSLSIIDGDEKSAAHHQVVASVGTGVSTKGVVMTPDGTRIYVGTDTGFIVFDGLNYSVIASVGTGASTKGVVMSPDGTLMFILTTSGEVLIVDIQPGPDNNTVVGSVGKGSSTKDVTLSPDGTLLYLIQDETDDIIVVAIEAQGSVSVAENGTTLPPPVLIITSIDTITAGEDPSAIAFDPSGSGMALVANAGDTTVTFFNTSSVPYGPVAASAVIDSRTLALPSRGRWIKGKIELDTEYIPEEVDIASVLMQDSIPAGVDNWEITDTDMDGIRELVVYFDRTGFQQHVPSGDMIPVNITGNIRGRSFLGMDVVTTVRPEFVLPSGGAVPTNSQINITWIWAVPFPVDTVDVHWSDNDGRTWQPVALKIPDHGFAVWQTPSANLDSCRVMVTAYSGGQDVGMGMSQEMFSVSPYVAVTLSSFTGGVESSAAVLRWSTSDEENIKGFHLLRSEDKSGGYQRINPALIPAAAKERGAAYAYRDSAIGLNREYYYKLQTVSGDGGRWTYGPYKVVYHARLSLAQNVPNPFNPTTMIAFTLPEKEHVKLSIFNVSGRLVKTLIDRTMTEGFKKAVWDGRESKGNPVGSGVYFYRLLVGNKVLTKKMVLLK